MLRLRRKSRTTTRPRRTLVSVPSQRSLHEPYGAAHGRGAVPPRRPEAAARVRAQAPDRATAEGGAGALAAPRPAAPEARALHDQVRQAPRAPPLRLAHLEQRVEEIAPLALAGAVGALQADRALASVEERTHRDLTRLRQRNEPDALLAGRSRSGDARRRATDTDPHRAGNRCHVHVHAQRRVVEISEGHRPGRWRNRPARRHRAAPAPVRQLVRHGGAGVGHVRGRPARRRRPS